MFSGNKLYEEEFLRKRERKNIYFLFSLKKLNELLKISIGI